MWNGAQSGLNVECRKGKSLHSVLEGCEFQVPVLSGLHGQGPIPVGCDLPARWECAYVVTLSSRQLDCPLQKPHYNRLGSLCPPTPCLAHGGCARYQVLEVEFLVFQGQTYLYPPNFQHKTGRELSNLCKVLYLLSRLLKRWLRESPSASLCLAVPSVHEDPASGLAQVQSCGKEGGERFLSLTRRGGRFVLASAHIAAGMPSLERVLHASARWHRSGAGVAQASCTSTNWWWRSRRAGGAQPSITASGFRWIPVWRESASLASRFSLGMSFWSPVIAAPWRKSEQRRKGK